MRKESKFKWLIVFVVFIGTNILCCSAFKDLHIQGGLTEYQEETTEMVTTLRCPWICGHIAELGCQVHFPGRDGKLFTPDDKFCLDYCDVWYGANGIYDSLCVSALQYGKDNCRSIEQKCMRIMIPGGLQ